MIGLRTTFTTRQICIYGVVASILFSMTVLLQHDLLNGDGVLYVRVAKLLQNGQFSDAIALYGWPFFSVLIAALDLVAGVGLDASAYILVTLLDALLLVAFILIVKELGGDTRVQIAAVVVIFSLAYLNENRADVIRDHGYWSCLLFSLLLYLKFFKTPGLWIGIGWSATILLGSLFRIEGLIMWVGLPLVVLFRGDTSARAKTQYLFTSYLLHIFAGIILASYLLTTNDHLFMATRLGGLKLEFLNFLNGLGVEMDRRISVLKTGVLDAKYSADFAGPSIVGIMMIILGSKIITAVSPPYVSVFFIPYLRARLKELDSRLILVLVWAAAINLLVVFFVLIPKLFLSARFLLPFALTVLVFVPFMLVHALDYWNKSKGSRRRRTRIILLILMLFILYGCLDGLISTSPSKIYRKEAGIWIKQNLDKESRIYANDPKIDHYAGRYKSPFGYVKLRPDMLYKFDYIVILLKRNHIDGMETISRMASCLSDIKQFPGPGQAVVKVYRVRHDNGCKAGQSELTDE